MPGKVVDASAVASVLFMEDRSELLRDRLSGPLAAPFLLPFELASACRSKMELEPEFAADCLERYRLLPRLEIRLEAIDLDRLPTTAIEHRLSAYDAAYLQLALDLDAELITLDARLDRAWRRAAG